MIDNEKVFNSILNEVKKYLAYLQFERNMSINTTESYYLDLKYYIEYLVFDKNIKSIGNINSSIVKSYINIGKNQIIIVYHMQKKLLRN